MNEETLSASKDLESFPDESATVATEGTDPSVPDETVQESIPETTVQETTVETTEETVTVDLPGSDPEELDGTQATIYEDFSGSEMAATEEVTVIEVIQTVGSDIAHANLFSGFLVCGTLVGIVLLRKIYGT